MALDLDPACKCQARAAIGVLRILQRLAQPDPGTDRHRRREPNAVRALIEALAALPHPINRFGQLRDERECQEAVGNRLAARHFVLRSLGIDVNPVEITGRLGEGIDHRLIDPQPVTYAKLLADVLHQLGGIFDGKHACSPIRS